MIRTTLVAIALIAIAAPAEGGDSAVTGRLANPGLDETSGIARSVARPGLLWAINDSSNAPLLFALERDGTDRGSVQVIGAPNRDWEDLASFERDGQPYLLIADTGDNASRRGVSFLYVVAEPEPDEQGHYSGTVRADRLVFRYEDGPRDCEAVAVDPETGDIVLIAKRLVPAPVYRLALPGPDEQARPLVARRIGTIGGLARPTPRELLDAPLGPFRHQPTALDIAADGRTAAIATYQNLYLYRRSPGESWADALAAPAQVLGLPLSQVESVALLDTDILAVAEGQGAELRVWRSVR